MKKYLVHIFTIVCTVLALITSTLAWMLGNQETQFVGSFGMDFGRDEEDNHLYVVSQDLSFEVLVQDTEGVYEPFDKYTFDEAVPGKIIPFEIRFYNSAGRVVSLDLSLSGITSKDREGNIFSVEDEDGQVITLIHHTFVSLMSDADFTQGVSAVEEYKCLGDGLTGAPGEEGHSLVVVPNMQIPKPEVEGTPYVQARERCGQ